MPFKDIDSIPLPNHAICMFKSKHADRSRLETETSPSRWWQFQPHRCDHPRKVSVGKQQNISIGGEASLDDHACASCDLINRFAVRTTITPEIPIETGIVFTTEVHRCNLRRCLTFVFAIIPFEQIRIGLNAIRESCATRSLHSPTQWA